MQKKYWIVTCAVWLLLISASAAWNASKLHEMQEQVYAESARSYFDLMVTVRQWNSELGGLYAPVTNLLQPNPYLDLAGRDILLPDGTMLTKVNPAYMTRLISALAVEKDMLQFHITSLNPIRPGNSPLDWEAKALESFEQQNSKEYYYWDHTKSTYYYIAPLYVTQSCLACHEKQGYKLGDVRGGISVVFHTNPISYDSILFSHSVILFVGYVAIVIFGRQLTQAITRLEHQSQVDALTGLYNRRYFDEYIRREYLRSKRHHTPLSIIFLDADYFKHYNDTYGHLAGDACLRHIADTIKESVHRPLDVSARYGGEEFAVILPDTPLEGGLQVAELIRSRVEALQILHSASKTSTVVTISLGVCAYNGGALDLFSLLEKVDQALYAAKQSGRNQVCLAPENSIEKEKV